MSYISYIYIYMYIYLLLCFFDFLTRKGGTPCPADDTKLKKSCRTFPQKICSKILSRTTIWMWKSLHKMRKASRVQLGFWKMPSQTTLRKHGNEGKNLVSSTPQTVSGISLAKVFAQNTEFLVWIFPNSFGIFWSKKTLHWFLLGGTPRLPRAYRIAESHRQSRLMLLSMVQKSQGQPLVGCFWNLVDKFWDKLPTSQDFWTMKTVGLDFLQKGTVTPQGGQVFQYMMRWKLQIQVAYWIVFIGEISTTSIDLTVTCGLVRGYPFEFRLVILVETHRLNSGGFLITQHVPFPQEIEYWQWPIHQSCPGAKNTRQQGGSCGWPYVD